MGTSYDGKSMEQKRKEFAPYRETQLEVGRQFQDFVVNACWDMLGLAIIQYSSQLYQQAIGESRTGAEIKRDGNFRTTGNLFIEINEKAMPRPGKFAESGINRDDNAWLFIIGDEDTFYGFGKVFLRQLLATGKYRVVPSRTETSNGLLLPIRDVEKYDMALFTLHPNAKEKLFSLRKDIADQVKTGKELLTLLKQDARQGSLFSENGDEKNGRHPDLEEDDEVA